MNAIIDEEFVEIQGFDASGVIVATASKGIDGVWRCRAANGGSDWTPVADYNAAIDRLTELGAVRTLHLTQAEMIARFSV